MAKNKTGNKAKISVVNDTKDREIVITRIIDAPRERVFAAWTDPKQIVQWWGPKGFTTTTHKMDVKVGGVWRFIMHGPDGVDYDNRIVYHEIKKPERLVYIHDGDKKNDPEQFQTTVTFDAFDAKTKLTMRSLFASAAQRKKVVEKYHAIEGGNQTLDRLGEYMKKISGGNVQMVTKKMNSISKNSKDSALVITRIFHAPIEKVWKAWTEPAQMKKWWGPKIFTAPTIKIDFRVGGKYLFCMHSKDGKDYWSTGIYKEIIPLKKIVCTDNFADAKGNVIPASAYGMTGDWSGEMLVTVTFEKQGKNTKMTMQEVGLPLGDMQGMAGVGWNESFDKLEKSLQ